MNKQKIQNVRKTNVGVAVHGNPKIKSNVGVALLGDPKGITLIALVINIVVLIILAGVTINLTIGQDGILKHAIQSRKEYEIAEIRETVEREILKLDMDKLSIGEKLTVEQALNGIYDNNIFEEINVEEEIGIIKGYAIRLGYNENQKVVILEIEKDTGTRIIAKIKPEGFTNENVEVEITVTTDNANVTSIEVPTEMVLKSEKVYQVEKNGTYKVKANLDNGVILEKEIVIDNIDKLQPIINQVNVESNKNEIQINIDAYDTEKTEESAKSELNQASYKYYIKLETETEYTEYTTNPIRINQGGKFNIYVEISDNAGNKTNTQNTPVTITKVSAPVSNYGLGDKVNYSANGVTDWNIFYKDETTNEVFIIASDPIPSDLIPADLGATINASGANWPGAPTSAGAMDISEIEKNKFKLSWAKQYNTSTSVNAKCTERMIDTEVWSSFAVKDGSYAIGSPTLEMLNASWNDWYGEDLFDFSINSNGYLVKGSTTDVDGSIHFWFSPDNILYNSTGTYFLASPCGSSDSSFGYKMNGRQLYAWSFLSKYGKWEGRFYSSFRPVVSLNSDLLSYDIDTQTWNVN